MTNRPSKANPRTGQCHGKGKAPWNSKFALDHECLRYRSGRRRSLNLRLEVRVWPTYNAPKFQASTASGPMTRPMHSEQRLRACSALGVLDPCVAAFSLPCWSVEKVEGVGFSWRCRASWEVSPPASLGIPAPLTGPRLVLLPAMLWD